MSGCQERDTGGCLLRDDGRYAARISFVKERVVYEWAADIKHDVIVRLKALCFDGYFVAGSELDSRVGHHDVGYENGLFVFVLVFVTCCK